MTTERFYGYAPKPAKTTAIATVVFFLVTVTIGIHRFDGYVLVSSYKQTLVGLLSICVSPRLIK